ncbi:hypothetical protein BC629DRAFT_635390 [Irpex lacteus]|nr:hypothetical protein BC629DRAFT_635390 [Irpex lacteus]
MGVSARLEALRNHHRWESMRDWTWEHIELLGWDPRIVETSHYSGNVWVQYLQWLNITVGGAAGPDGDFTETCEAKCVTFEKAADGTPIADSWTLSFSESARFDDCIADLSQNTLYLIGIAVVEGQRCRKVRAVSLTNGLILAEKLFPASREQDPVPGHIPTRELSVHKPHGRSIIAYLEIVTFHGADKVQAEIGLLDLESGEVIDAYAKEAKTAVRH